MRDTRRQFLKSSGGLLAALTAAGFLRPGQLRAEEWNKAAFESKKLEDVVKALGGSAPAQSEAISIVAADIAENGAAVPIGIVAKLPDVQAIAIVIEKNPNVLAAVFDIPKGTHAEILTRVKMAETCNVYALVKAGGKFYYTSKEIKVTLGGCGG